MTLLQIFFLVLLIALLLIVGVLLLLSGRDSRATRVGSGSAGRKNTGCQGLDDHSWRDQSQDDESLSGEERRGGASSQAGGSERKWETRQQSPIATEADLPSAQIMTDAGQSVERPRSIQNSPPATLRSRAKLYHYTALVTSVYDGDTLTVDIDLGMNMTVNNQVIRLWKINTPELRGPGITDIERQKGLEVRDLVRKLVLHKYILLRTILDKRGRDKTGKYGRLLGEILIENDDGEVLNVNEYLLAKGLAEPFGAGGSAIKQPANAPMPQRSASPMPNDIFDKPGFDEPDEQWAKPPSQHAQNQRLPNQQQGKMPCPHCGESRAVDLENQVVLNCPNCMDGSYWYGEQESGLGETGGG